MKTSKKLLITSLISAFLLGYASKALVNIYRNYEPPRSEIIIELENISLKDSIYNYIQELNIQHPEIVFKQAMLESGNLTSKIFKENRNIFGMRIAKQRAFIHSGGKNGYAVYNNWKESVIDYALFQMQNGRNLTESQYLDLLQRIYAEDSNYKQKLINYK